MKSTGYNGRQLRSAGVDDDVYADDQTIFDKTFTHIQTSFLTLFRMLLGDFDIQWFIRDGETLLTAYSVGLFILCKCDTCDSRHCQLIQNIPHIYLPLPL